VGGHAVGCSEGIESSVGSVVSLLSGARTALLAVQPPAGPLCSGLRRAEPARQPGPRETTAQVDRTQAGVRAANPTPRIHLPLLKDCPRDRRAATTRRRVRDTPRAR
jgi:hypothetical protein